MLLDVGKGFAAALLGLWAGGALVGVLAGAAAMLGHARPGLPPLPEGREDGRDRRRRDLRARPARRALLRRACGSLAFLLTRYASVASIVTALALVLFVWLFGARGRCSRSPSRAPPRSSSSTATTSVASRGHGAPLRAPPPAPGVVTVPDGPAPSLEPGRERRLALARGARAELASELADRAEALGDDVVPVDRLEVDLPREEEVVVVEAR